MVNIENGQNLQKERFKRQKIAISEILSSENGKLLLQYLSDITFTDMGTPLKDISEYAFKQGQRSLLITLLQVAEMPISNFCLESLEDMINFNERIMV